MSESFSKEESPVEAKEIHPSLAVPVPQPLERPPSPVHAILAGAAALLMIPLPL